VPSGQLRWRTPIDQVYPIWRDRGHRMLSPDHAGIVSEYSCAAPAFLLRMIRRSRRWLQTGLLVAHESEMAEGCEDRAGWKPDHHCLLPAQAGSLPHGEQHRCLADSAAAGIDQDVTLELVAKNSYQKLSHSTDRLQDRDRHTASA